LKRAIPSIEIRAAVNNDVEAIARLAGELGYPSTVVQVRARLDAIEGDAQQAAFVAEAPDGEVVGWIHLSQVCSLASDPRAEITGLVVDSGIRGAGVGGLLVERGETWAREIGLTTIGVHSNIMRERAHSFYMRLGYAVNKSQKVFRKTL
jgi:N-acetylglutamate synthase-like GNAT family acetyltransferase